MNRTDRPSGTTRKPFYLDNQHLFFRKYRLDKIAGDYQLLYATFDQARFMALIKSSACKDHNGFQSLSKGFQALVMVALALASGHRMFSG